MFDDVDVDVPDVPKADTGGATVVDPDSGSTDTKVDVNDVSNYSIATVEFTDVSDNTGYLNVYYRYDETRYYFKLYAGDTEFGESMLRSELNAVLEDSKKIDPHSLIRAYVLDDNEYPQELSCREINADAIADREPQSVTDTLLINLKTNVPSISFDEDGNIIFN